MHDVQELLADAGGPNPRLALASVKALADELDWLLVRAVHLARAEHYDWARIGRLLGVSRQAARQRFERLAPLVDPLPPHVRGRTPWQQQHAAIIESGADARRRQRFESFADDGHDVEAW